MFSMRAPFLIAFGKGCRQGSMYWEVHRESKFYNDIDLAPKAKERVLFPLSCARGIQIFWLGYSSLGGVLD